MLERVIWNNQDDHFQNCADSLKHGGWWFSRSQDTERAFSIDMDCEWFEFAAHWDRLLRDEYMKDGGTYRYRRYSAFTFDANDRTLHQLPHAPYVQSMSVNKLNGGFERHFEPLEPTFVEHPVLSKILTNIGAIISEVEDHSQWNIKLHPYRILARQDQKGEPTPEGLHRDGVDYIVSYMIGRTNVHGGISSITDVNESILGDIEMNRANDFVIGDDRVTLHGVSSLEVQNHNMPFAYRDVLVIAFEKS